MNLTYAHKILLAADQQRHGFLRIRGRQADHEVRRMVKAGLLDATLSDGEDDSFTAINRLTDFGRKLVRTLKDPDSRTSSSFAEKRTAGKRQSDSQAAVLEKWRVNFALGLPPFQAS
jgi:hypothetical protein